MSLSAVPPIHAGPVFGREDTLSYTGWDAASALPVEDGLEWVERSGLRGRGGAGFPTGSKLRLTFEASTEPKYVVVNGAEDEPGSGKDQALLEHAPGLVVEGALIAARLVGARQVVFYISEVFPSSATSVEVAAAAGGVVCSAWVDDAADTPRRSSCGSRQRLRRTSPARTRRRSRCSAAAAPSQPNGRRTPSRKGSDGDRRRW